MNRVVQQRRWVFFGLAALVASLGTLPSVRADALDSALRIRAAKEIMPKLRADGYHNIGVLRFRVQKGKAEPTFTAGLLNSAMATRLENALILADSEKHPVGITRDAGTVAANKDRRATYLTTDGRRQLFDNEYPLAWDRRQVKVDAFLTGLVQVSPDMRQSTVIVQLFNRKHPENLQEIDQFTVRNDLGVFSDLGTRYSVVKRDLRLGADNSAEPETAPARPHKARQPVVPPRQTQETASQVVPPRQTQQTPSNVVPVAYKDDLEALELIDFKVYYDDRLMPLVQRSGDCTIPPPTDATKEIRFDLANKTGKPLAVVVLVNGINTVNGSEQGKAPAGYTKWILKDQRTYSINGIWSADGQTVHRFKVASAAQLAAMSDLNLDKLGQIEIFVFPQAQSRDMLAKVTPQDLNLKDRAQ